MCVIIAFIQRDKLNMMMEAYTKWIELIILPIVKFNSIGTTLSSEFNSVYGNETSSRSIEHKMNL